MDKAPARQIVLSRAATDLLEEEKRALEARLIEHIRLVPLILREPLEVVIKRRLRVFTTASYTKTPYGYEIDFTRQLKKQSTHGESRIVKGTFGVISIADDIAVVVVTSDPDVSKHGPKRFCDKTYPLARRPFFTSTNLVGIIDRFSNHRGLLPVTLVARGYHRQTGRSRQDCFRQSPSEAVMEMAAQDRSTHSLLVSFRRNPSREIARIAFDRTASANVKAGDPITALRDLVLPGVFESLAASTTFQIERADEPVEQEMVELEFRESTFDNFDAMYALCDAVRKGDGLNASIIHLNPYLQAQILDFFTGKIVDMLVVDQTNVSLIPRSPDAGSAIERISTTIFEHFGEAKARRMTILESI